METKKQAYISGALTSVWERLKLKVFYEEIGASCESRGIFPYVPHKYKSLDTNPDISVEEMYHSNMEQVDKSNLMIAYVGTPSQGTGMEIERANKNGIKVIILSEKDKSVSRMVKGCPAVIKHIVFTDFSDAKKQLDQALEELIAENKI
ncbi:MAG: nucleoside 2-deoxyribosyltransferase [Firmicutes bacterium]|nr:nucleoside 2-deoxyribosyltransferase [Bacillota bacterium]